MKTRKELQKNNEHELKSRQCRQNQPKSAGILPAEWRVRIEPTAKTGIVPCPCHCPVMQVSPLTKSQHSTAQHSRSPTSSVSGCSQVASRDAHEVLLPARLRVSSTGTGAFLPFSPRSLSPPALCSQHHRSARRRLPSAPPVNVRPSRPHTCCGRRTRSALLSLSLDVLERGLESIDRWPLLWLCVASVF